MDKIIGEEDLKGLEEEIDSAVERLFVEKTKGRAESLSIDSHPEEPTLPPLSIEPAIAQPTQPEIVPTIEPKIIPPLFESSFDTSLKEAPLQSSLLEPTSTDSFLEPSFDLEKSFEPEIFPSPPPPPPVLFLKSVEKMEALLLTLEWEITNEKLRKTKEEVEALKAMMKERPDVISVLTFMDKVLSHMIKNEENIRPPWIKFLLDSKETLKLLLKKEGESEISLYKQLAYQGIEARFSCLEGIRETQASPSSFEKSDRTEKKDLTLFGEEKIEEMRNRMDAFMERMENIFQTMKQQLSRLEEAMRPLPNPVLEGDLPTVNITIFKVEEKLFGVETEKVFKLFKVPHSFSERYSNQQKVRLKDVEVKMVDLKKLFSITGGEPKEEIRILTVKDNGGYKGFMVDGVLKKLSTTPDQRKRVGEYFSGIVHSMVQDQSVEIPLLDLKKF